MIDKILGLFGYALITAPDSPPGIVVIDGRVVHAHWVIIKKSEIRETTDRRDGHGSFGIARVWGNEMAATLHWRTGKLFFRKTW